MFIRLATCAKISIRKYYFNVSRIRTRIAKETCTDHLTITTTAPSLYTLNLFRHIGTKQDSVAKATLPSIATKYTMLLCT